MHQAAEKLLMTLRAWMKRENRLVTLDTAIAKGLSDAEAGRVKDIETVRQEVRKQEYMSKAETKRPLIVNLWNIAGTGLIIPYPSGILYSNQVGGYSCDHPAIEGFFVPVTTGEKTCPLSLALLDFFQGEKWTGHCNCGIDIETADHLDSLFKNYASTQFIRVDRNASALKSSEEAWVYVTLHYPDEKYPLLSGIHAEKAILTWPNSD